MLGYNVENWRKLTYNAEKRECVYEEPFYEIPMRERQALVLIFSMAFGNDYMYGLFSGSATNWNTI